MHDIHSVILTLSWWISFYLQLTQVNHLLLNTQFYLLNFNHFSSVFLEIVPGTLSLFFKQLYSMFELAIMILPVVIVYREYHADHEVKYKGPNDSHK